MAACSLMTLHNTYYLTFEMEGDYDAIISLSVRFPLPKALGALSPLQCDSPLMVELPGL